jgi:protein-L-isoaspartate(D-aspartate) O-methyltransferase
MKTSLLPGRFSFYNGFEPGRQRRAATACLGLTMRIQWKATRAIGLVFLVLGVAVACGIHAEGMGNDFQAKRREMVKQQLALRDISDPAVLKAMGKVPRHEFVPQELRSQAYADWPLPIGHDQTISQPYIVAYMSQALDVKPGDKVLEVGTGSGYQAAVLVEMGADVYSVEIIASLGAQARETLERLGYKAHLRVGDGYDGWPEAAPFDGIVVTAAPKLIPVPLIDQLREGGRLVIPVGQLLQTLKVFKKERGKLVLKQTLPVRFVPMTGKSEGK